MSPKVLIIMSCYYPVVGGLEKRIQTVAQFLVKKGIEVTVLTKKRDSSHLSCEQMQGVTVLREKGNVKGLLIKAAKLCSQFDTVILAGQLSNNNVLSLIVELVFGVFLKSLAGKKVLFLPSSSAVFYDKLTGNLKGVCLGLAKKLTSVVCVSEDQKSFFSDKPMVVFDTPWGPPRKGGIQTMSLNLAGAFKKQGINPVILTRKDVAGQPDKGIVKGISIQRVCVSGIKHLSDKLVFLLANLKKIQAYVICGSYEKDFGITLVLIATILKLCNKKILVRLSSELGHVKTC